MSTSSTSFSSTSSSSSTSTTTLPPPYISATYEDKLNILQNGLVSYWNFDDNNGVGVGDLNRLNPGTWQGTLGAQWTQGMLKFGGRMNGTDNDVLVLESTSIKPTSAISVGMWVYPSTATQNNFSTLLSRGNFYYFEGNGTNPAWDFACNVNGVEKNSGFTSNLSINQWHLVVGTYDSATGLLAVYLDGVLANSTNQSGTITQNTGDLYIGQRNGFTRFFTGKMDEVFIYQRALSSAEIKLIYNLGNGLPMDVRTFPMNAYQYSNISVDDGDYFIQTGSEYMSQEYKKTWTNNTDSPSFTWMGRTTQSTIISPILIQIYNQVTFLWETLATVNTLPADVDKQFTVKQTTNISNYYDSTNTVTFRSYQQVV